MKRLLVISLLMASISTFAAPRPKCIDNNSATNYIYKTSVYMDTRNTNDNAIAAARCIVIRTRFMDEKNHCSQLQIDEFNDGMDISDEQAQIISLETRALTREFYEKSCPQLESKFCQLVQNGQPNSISVGIYEKLLEKCKL